MTSAPQQNLLTRVEQAVTRSAGLQASSAQIREADAGVKQAEAMRLPQLSADIAATRGDGPVYVFGSLLNQQKFGPANFAIDSLNSPTPLTNIKSALLLGVPLFTGFEIRNEVRLNGLTKEAALTEHEGTLQQIRFETARVYLQALYDDAVLAVLDAHLKLADQELKEASRLKDRGVILGSDFFAAQAIGGNLKSWRIQLESDRKTVLKHLSILTGDISPNVTGKLSAPLYSVPPLEDLISSAIESRPAIRRSQTQITMAEVARDREGQTWLPKVQAFAAIESNTEDFHSNPTNQLYGVSAHVPFGDLTYSQRKKRAAAGLDAARFSRTALEDQIRSELTADFYAYQGLLQKLSQIEENVAQAERSLELFRPLYRSGRQSILDVLRAEEATAHAKAAREETLFDLHVGYLRLMAGAGRLDAKSIQQISDTVARVP